MQFVNNLYHGVQDYWKDIPTNTGKNMICNAGAGFVVGIMFTGNLGAGATTAAVVALATAIYGLVTPIFKSLLDSDPILGETCRVSIAMTSAVCITAASGNIALLDRIGRFWIFPMLTGFAIAEVLREKVF